MQAEPTEWRLRAVYGSARLLEHCHEGGQAPLCALKGVVQVRARGGAAALAARARVGGCVAVCACVRV